jgi:hypothetical protein
MAKQTINIGASPNDGTGTPLRTSFDYTNQNFTEIYTALGGGVGLPGATTQVIFNDGGTNLAGDAGLVYNKTTDALTVAGLVTAGSATITGDLTVDTSTLKVDSTNNRVGIGTASPTAVLTVNGEISVTDNFALRLGSTQAGGATLLYNGSGNLDITPRSGFHTKFTDGNLVIGTSGKGIDFSATANGSGTMTSELLNDYEEGVWDAVFITGGGTVTINPAANQCRYTKIGRLVTVQGNIAVSSVSSPTGPLLISGLPYTIASGTEGDSITAMSVMAQGLQTTATGQIVGYGVAGSVAIYMYRYELGAIIGLAPSAKAASEFAFSMTYSV